MSALREAAKAVLPPPVRERVVAYRADRRRVREHLELYGPAQPIDLAPLARLRSAPLDELADPARLERLLPELGLNDEHLDQFPPHLYPFCGTGLRHWQYPSQFAPYLAEVARHRVRSYLEIGTRHGGTFVLTVEYLRRFTELRRAVGIDIQPAAGLDAYAREHPFAEALTVSSREARFASLVRRGAPWDLVLIDGDHGEEAVRADYRLVRDHANMLVFHDIVSSAVPGVGIVWREAQEELAGAWTFHEFIAQYDEVQERHGEPFLGLGLAVRNHGREADGM